MSDEEKITHNEFGKTTEYPDGSAKVETKFGTIQLDKDGNAKISHETGNYTFDGDGNAGGHIDRVDKVLIEDISNIEYYNVTNERSVAKHHVRFKGGGELFIAFDETGKLLGCQGGKLRLSMTTGYELKISCIPEQE